MVNLIDFIGVSKLYHPGTTGAAVTTPEVTTYTGISPLWIIIIISVVIAIVGIYLWHAGKDE